MQTIKVLLTLIKFNYPLKFKDAPFQNNLWSFIYPYDDHTHARSNTRWGSRSLEIYFTTGKIKKQTIYLYPNDSRTYWVLNLKTGKNLRYKHGK